MHMPPRIRPRTPIRLYLAKWRDRKGLTQQQVADRLETSDVTISRWETGERRPDLNAQAAYAEALGIELPDLWRDPDRPSADELLRGQPQDVVDQAMNIIKAIRRH
jgi:transcriptional regulator with XRE-family HTH domain